MEKAIAEKLYEEGTGGTLSEIRPMAGAGSSRRYFRLEGTAGSAIATEGDDRAENEAFIYLSNHLGEKGLPVPKVLAADDSGQFYLQSDLGDTSLYSLIEKKDSTLDAMLEKSMEMLAEFHRSGAEGLDFTRCFPVAAMDAQAVMWDLNYFKYCFLKLFSPAFSEPLLEEDFKTFAALLTEGLDDEGVFMVRDFQSRNVMIHDGGPWLIDFQGGRKGLPQYDLASFLWQARAGFTHEQRTHLIDVYLEASGRDRAPFLSKLNLFVIFRLLQVLGAYGFRGYTQRKAAFMKPVGKAVASLREMLPFVPESCAYLRTLLEDVCTQPQFDVAERDGLTVHVNSFSFKNGGAPIDLLGNGGGFVFDCRAIHNPGRYDEYKSLTGRDEPVRRFLEDDGEVLTFLEHVYQLVDSSVERYLSRGFSDLQVNFGCTGGRHRSVYCAEAVAHHLAERGDVNVSLTHVAQNIKSYYPRR